MPARVEVHVPLLTEYVREKLYIHRSSVDVGYCEGNSFLLTAKDSFIRYCRAYPNPNKEARTVAKVLVDQHFNIYGIPDQLHSDNGREFVNNL